MAEIVVFDWKRTLYDPENRKLIDGSLDVLQNLGAKGLKLYLVGKDQNGDMPKEAGRLGVSEFFHGVHFVNESKTTEDINQFINSDHPELAVVVGDRVRSEIQIGNQLGLTTVWIRNGRFAQETPLQPDQIPNYTIGAIAELVPLIDSL